MVWLWTIGIHSYSWHMSTKNTLRRHISTQGGRRKNLQGARALRSLFTTLRRQIIWQKVDGSAGPFVLWLIRVMRRRWSGWGVGKALDSTQRGGECCSTHKPVADYDILGSEESKASLFKCSLLQKEKTIKNIMPFKWSHLQSKPSTLPTLLHLKNLRDP